MSSPFSPACRPELFRWVRRSTAPARISSLFAKSSRAAQLLLFDSSACSRAFASDRSRPARQPDLPLLAHLCSRRCGWPKSMPTASRGRSIRKGACVSTRARCCSILTASASLARRRERVTQQEGPGDKRRDTRSGAFVVDPAGYDWEGDAPIRRPFAKTVLYEMHVGGFTPASKLGRRNRASAETFAGLIEKIPYLRDPRRECGRASAGLCVRPGRWPAGARQLLGIPSAFVFRPARRPTAPVGTHSARWTNFATWFKALHRAGIEVILDVVYNHTAESDENGPDHQLPRTFERDVLHPCRRSVALRQFSPAAAIR